MISSDRFKVVSLFSGVGGLDLGFKEAGFEIVFANDVLESRMMTYSMNFGLELNYCLQRSRYIASAGEALVCDVALVDFSNLASEDVDVVVGGPPCQDFSVVRGPRRRGIEVKRGNLYIHFIRALAQIKPKVFVFENVPGLVSSNGGLAFNTIIDGFLSMGYMIVFSDIVDLSKLGVPQRRKRIIVIGVRSDINVSKNAITMAVSALMPDKTFTRFPITPIEVFEGRILPDLQDKYRELMMKWDGVWHELGTQRAFEWNLTVWRKLTFDVVRDYLIANGIDRASESELEEVWNSHKRALNEMGYLGVSVCSNQPPDGTCINEESDMVIERMRMIPPGENHEFVRGTKWEIEGRGISLVYRRIHPLKPSYTIVAYGGGGTHGYHYDRDRATLNLRERARLQTFPDSFLFSGSRTEVRAQIGEAVPVLASKRISEAVKQLLLNS